MKRRVYDLVGMDSRVRRERLRTLDDATFTDLLDALRTKVNLMLNRQRQSYEEEKDFLRKAFFALHTICVSQSRCFFALLKLPRKWVGKFQTNLSGWQKTHKNS